MILAIAAITACALLADGPPENTCRSDADCFRAQGEVCDLDNHRCVPGPDGGVTVDAPVD